MARKKRRGFIYPGRRKAYRSMKRKFGATRLGKSKAARIANAGRSHAQRVRMARKAARTRKRRGR